MSQTTSTTPRATRFAEALQTLERTGETAALVEQFADHAEVGNATTPASHRGREGAEAFWAAYHATFDEISSEFRVVVEGEAGAALEWRSSGTLVSGADFAYGGVTVLEFDGDAVSRFTAYFDPSGITPV
ncbi:MAG: family NAD(P)-dependent oxidoreductase [Solirubrobacterales bacterium]|nr:family NAD(P)-dependent oxidoreductase [Solirubrobacterales bacterium]